MKKILILAIAVIGLSSCNDTTRVFDSEVSAIRDQTDMIEAQNKLIGQQNVILGKIALELETKEGK